jgi:hypothetical protein
MSRVETDVKIHAYKESETWHYVKYVHTYIHMQSFTNNLRIHDKNP